MRHYLEHNFEWPAWLSFMCQPVYEYDDLPAGGTTRQVSEGHYNNAALLARRAAAGDPGGAADGDGFSTDEEVEAPVFARKDTKGRPIGRERGGAGTPSSAGGRGTASGRRPRMSSEDLETPVFAKADQIQHNTLL